MSTCMTKITQNQALSGSIKMEEETSVVMQKQGIVTILASDCDTTTNMSSLQRTLSADMSSKKWLSQNKSSFPMKKIASFEEIFHPKTIADSLSSSSEDEEGEGSNNKEAKETTDPDADAEAERERLEIWSSIQRNKKEEQEKGGAFDMWNSLISLKKNKDEIISKSLPVTPYVHPLVKRSKSSLSEKSLEICTESLGSETGSDGLLSSYPPSSSTGEATEEIKQQQQQQKQEKKVIDESQEELQEFPRHNHHVTGSKKCSPPRSFPPPLPSLSSRQVAAWPSLTMRSHRDNGRLVLEAVSVPSQNKFSVQRQDGRLVLTFSNHFDRVEDVDADEVAENDGVEELEEEFEEDCDETEEEEEEEEVWENEKAPIMSTTNSVQRLGIVMNKPIGVVNRNPNWSEKFNNEVVVEQKNPSVAKSLPPIPRVARLIPSTKTVASSAAASSFNCNAYEYYWKTNSTTKTATHNNESSPLKDNLNLNNNNYNNKLIVSKETNRFSNDQQQLLVLRGKNGDYLVHNWKNCKDSRRSFLFWEPYCIATS